MYNSLSNDLLGVIMFLAIISLVIILPIKANSDNSGAIRTLELNGFKNVTMGGYAFLGCGQDDYYRKNFTATKEGNTVTGYVCGGMFKGYTLRFN